MEKVIIVGSGCAGLTAAIYAARANLRRRVLQTRAGLRHRWWRFRGGRITFPHALRLENLSDSSARQNARVQNHGRSRLGEQKDRANLEHSRDKIYSE